MPAEAAFLLGLHGHAGPWLDRFFLLSHYLGTLQFCVPFVLVQVLWHGTWGDRKVARTWLGVGLATYVLQEGLKRLVARPRPLLWPRLDTWPPVAGSESFAFPSGHALAAAAFYPLLAFVLVRHASPLARRLAVATGILMAFWIGFGRLYLGVHWPTDVLAGWALGGLLSAVAIRKLGTDRS